MIDSFLFVGLPYLAMAVGVLGAIHRFRSDPFSYSSLSSQFLESRQLLWGSAPWHIGMLVLLFGHAFALCMPTVWGSLMANRIMLIAAETGGAAAGSLCVAGLSVLIYRRLTSARIQAVTSTMDLVVLGLLLGQVILGMITAVQYRWGCVWITGTAAPYLLSLIQLQPDMALVGNFPAVFKLHLIGASVLLLVLPFSRLVHFFAVPVGYPFRPPQKVVWNVHRGQGHASVVERAGITRRNFVRGSAGVAASVVLLSMGVLDKLVRFFHGPRLEGAEEAALLEKKLQRLKLTAEQRELELERLRNEYILVGRYAELQPAKGKYFTDYAMAPGLAFKGADGLPILISAKCTHLGCTVGSELNAQGKILCPCHISYFDIRTGMPDPGAPAKDPLHHIAWSLMDAGGKVVASRGRSGPVQGAVDAALLNTCSLYIAKPREEKI
jgi:nitrate reductase gamma subunit